MARLKQQTAQSASDTKNRIASDQESIAKDQAEFDAKNKKL